MTTDRRYLELWKKSPYANMRPWTSDGKMAFPDLLKKTKTNPAIGTKLTPVRFTVRGKTLTGKAKRVGTKVKIFVTPQVARKVNPRVGNPVVHEVVEVRYTDKGPVSKVIAKLPHHAAQAKIVRMKKLHLDRSYRLGQMSYKP